MSWRLQPKNVGRALPGWKSSLKRYRPEHLTIQHQPSASASLRPTQVIAESSGSGVPDPCWAARAATASKPDLTNRSGLVARPATTAAIHAHTAPAFATRPKQGQATRNRRQTCLVRHYMGDNRQSPARMVFGHGDRLDLGDRLPPPVAVVALHLASEGGAAGTTRGTRQACAGLSWTAITRRHRRYPPNRRRLPRRILDRGTILFSSRSSKIS